MELCNKCGTLMIPKKEKNKSFLVCRKCKNKKKIKETGRFKIKEKIEKDPIDSIPILEESVEILPKIKINCPECGNPEAVWWTMQTRSSDEAETRFYRCIKCKRTWREYS